VRYLIYIAFLLFSISTYARPITLLGCFADAASNDPIYQEQVAIYKATLQTLPENFSAVLPQFSFSSAAGREFETMGQLGKGFFTTNSYGVQANQTVFNYTQFKQIAQARLAVKAAFATLTAQQQDLMMRTATGYLNVLRAHDLLEFAKQQKHYLSEQLSATKTLFEHEDATITDLEQAQGAYDLINAEYNAAEINLYNSIQDLSQITGIRYHEFTYLNPRFPLIKPNPEKIETWIGIANRQNWALRAARLTIMANREAVKATQGNFLPSVTASTGLTNATVPSLFLIDSVPLNTRTVGVNANWNFFQGGLTVAQVKAAIATVQQSEATMRQQYLQTMANTRKSYTDIEIGVARVKNVRASLEANTKALNHAQEAYRAGELTITEILQIQYQLYRAQTLYADYVYDYLLNILLLKQAAGILDVDSLAQINSWLDFKNHSKMKRKT
jgi:outer membrane protein